MPSLCSIHGIYDGSECPWCRLGIGSKFFWSFLVPCWTAIVTSMAMWLVLGR